MVRLSYDYSTFTLSFRERSKAISVELTQTYDRNSLRFTYDHDRTQTLITITRSIIMLSGRPAIYVFVFLSYSFLSLDI